MSAFGTDLSCVDDLDAAFSMVTGDKRTIQEAIARRLITPRGGIIDDPDYGYPIPIWLNEAITKATPAQMRGEIRAEVLKDERVLTANVTVQVNGPPSAIQFLISVDGESVAGPYDLVLAVDGLTAEILDEKVE